MKEEKTEEAKVGGEKEVPIEEKREELKRKFDSKDMLPRYSLHTIERLAEQMNLPVVDLSTK
jgi:hypothetical protein